MGQALTIRELQDIYLTMLEKFHAFCAEHGLTYYMVGGTLLGAVREQGFIPWDDDVDLAMPREDYERFLRLSPEDVILCPPGSKGGHCFPYTKLFHATIPTVYVEDAEFGMHGEVIVQFDIYPIDGLGEDERKARKYVKKISKWKHLLYLNQSKDHSKSPLKNVVLQVLRWLPGAAMAKQIDRMMGKFKGKKSVFSTRWREGTENGNVVATEVFGKPVLLPFDRLQLYAPQDFHTYLTGVYGNYQEPRRDNAGLRHDIGNLQEIKGFVEK